MRNWILVFISCFFISQVHAAPAPVVKEWTFLVFLNGFNNLDSFGTSDLNEMEKVGSTKDVNVVVQWASYRAGVVKRLAVQKDNDTVNVTSPILEDIGRADMGDYRTLVDFVKWAKIHYPAKKYFIDVWNHGSGWHKGMKREVMRNISSDDFSGNSMTTAQLGLAMNDIAAELGQKVDIYGSDACLMSMVEVAAEMKDSVKVYLGSQDLEPGPGWPYDKILAKWTRNPTGSAQDVAKILVQEYVASYPNRSGITQSAFDMSQYASLASSVRDLGLEIRSVSSAEKATVLNAAMATTSYYFDDYKDVGHFASLLQSRFPLSASVSASVSQVKSSLAQFVVANASSSDLPNASGVSFWFPENASTYDRYSATYRGLNFNSDTHWSDALSHLLK